MKATNISEALGYIDDSLILEAESAKRNKTPIFKWCSLAACLAIAVMAIITYLAQPSADPVIPGRDSGDIINPGENTQDPKPSVSPYKSPIQVYAIFHKRRACIHSDLG